MKSKIKSWIRYIPSKKNVIGLMQYYFQWEKLYRIFAGLLAVGVIWDSLIKYQNVWHIEVSNGYCGVTFGALCTVATLGNAVLSIMLSCFKEKILGFPVQMLIKFESSTIKLDRVLWMSMLSAGVAIIALTLDYCTTISILILIVIIVTLKSSIDIWMLLADRKYVRELLSREVFNTEKYAPDFFLAPWFSELESAVFSNYEAEQEEYTALIQLVAEAYTKANIDISNVLTKRMQHAFLLAIPYLGFVDAFYRILKIQIPEEKVIVDKRGSVSKYINQIKYLTPNDIQERELAQTVEDIVKIMIEDDYDRAQYIFQIFDNVAMNHIIPNELRYQILDDIIYRLSYLQDKADDSVRGRAILYIFKHYVLGNENKDERQNIIKSIVENLFIENRFSEGEQYISVLSQIFRGLCFYCLYETETLTAEYRSELTSLYRYASEGKDNYRISLATLVGKSQEAIIKWLTDNALARTRHIDIFDYFPHSAPWKNTIWSKAELLHFAFFLYLIWGYKFAAFPVEDAIQNDNLTLSDKINLCASIMTLSDDNYNLTENARSRVREVQEFLHESSVSVDNYARNNFKYINREHEALKAQQSQEQVDNVTSDTELLKSETLNRLTGIAPFVYNSGLSMDDAISIKIKPQLRLITSCNAKSSAGSRASEIRYILNDLIKSILPVELISFNLDGVRRLLELITPDDFQFRNYTYINDWALGREVHESPEFPILAQMIERIPYTSTQDVNYPIFLKESEIEYNFTIQDYRFESPEDEQCDSYIQSFKVAEGKYRIDGIILDYASAINYIHTNYRVEYSEIKIATALNSNSGFRIIHHKKREK